jgi:hypothetical protein
MNIDCTGSRSSATTIVSATNYVMVDNVVSISSLVARVLEVNWVF